ncbi:MAG: hypothetical protein RLY16_2526 [Bacteroidota bacterium]
MRIFNWGLLLLACVCMVNCKKSSTGGGTVAAPADSIPTDPATAASIGFFMDNWQPRNFSAGETVTVDPITGAANTTVTVNTGAILTKIAFNYFGNNSNLWCGQLNQQAVLMNHLTNFNPRILRGPAGSVSDIFFFNRPDGTAPADAPDSLRNAAGQLNPAGYWYGKNTANWTFSIDGYYNMLQQTSSIGLLTVNYGYARYGLSANPVAAAAHLAADWVRYDQGRTKYWEVGNESFGEWEAGYRINTATNRDGQPEIITGALYGTHFKVFADSMRAAARETGATIKIGAVLYDSPPANFNTATIQNWNSGVITNAGASPDYYVVHNYFTPYQQNSNVATVLGSATSVPTDVKNYIDAGLLAAGLPMKPIAMTEWNLFASGSKQNVSAIAGVHSVVTIGEFLKQKFGASLRWDLANRWENGDDHGLFNYGDEPGVATWNPRPAFYYMYFLQKMLGDRLLPSTVSGNTEIYSIASSFTSGQKGVVLANRSLSGATVEVKFNYFTPGAKFYYYLLTPGTDDANFSRMVSVNGFGPANNVSGGPYDSYSAIKVQATSTANGVKVVVPARGVVYLVVDKRN